MTGAQRGDSSMGGFCRCHRANPCPAQRGDFERLTSPQPSNRDEPVDLMSRLRASIDQARAEFAAAAADQPGHTRRVVWQNGRYDVWPDEPTPSAGQPGAGGEADGQCTGHYDCRADDPHWGACPWTSGHPKPTPAAGQDTERLRDEIARQFAGDRWEDISESRRDCWRDDVDMFLATPAVRQLIDQRDEARAQVQRVRELAEEIDREAVEGAMQTGLTVDQFVRAWRANAPERLRRALDGPT